MKLYELLSEEETVSVSKGYDSSILHLYVDELTILDLRNLSNHIKPKFAHTGSGALVCLEELFLRQHHKEVTSLIDQPEEFRTMDKELTKIIEQRIEEAAKQPRFNCKNIDYLPNGLDLHFDGHRVMVVWGDPKEIKLTLAEVRDREMKDLRDRLKAINGCEVTVKIKSNEGKGIKP